MHTCIFTFLDIHSHITYKWWNNKIIKICTICSHVKMQILRNQVCITTLFNYSFRTVTACWYPKRWAWFKFASPRPLVAGEFTMASSAGGHDGLNETSHFLLISWLALIWNKDCLGWWSQLTIPYSWWKWAPTSEISIAKFVAFVGWTSPWMLAMSVVLVNIHVIDYIIW